MGGAQGDVGGCLVRCEHGDRTKLGVLYVLPDALLFVSRIPWLPSDQLTLPPWGRDAYLSDPHIEDMSDEMLSDWLDRLDEWTAGKPADGPRWLASAPEWRIRDDLTIAAGPSGWLPDLWVRCSSRHPGQAEAVDRRLLMEAARRTSRSASRR